MLVSIAKLLAYVAFAFARPFVFVRQNRTLLSLFTVTAVASVLATLGATVLLGARGAPLTENADASALGSFVSANGTTANEWQIAGPNGPGFVDDAGALDLLPNVSLAGAPGTGTLAVLF